MVQSKKENSSSDQDALAASEAAWDKIDPKKQKSVGRTAVIHAPNATDLVIAQMEEQFEDQPNAQKKD